MHKQAQIKTLESIYMFKSNRGINSRNRSVKTSKNYEKILGAEFKFFNIDITLNLFTSRNVKSKYTWLMYTYITTCRYKVFKRVNSDNGLLKFTSELIILKSLCSDGWSDEDWSYIWTVRQTRNLLQTCRLKIQMRFAKEQIIIWTYWKYG